MELPVQSLLHVKAGEEPGLLWVRRWERDYVGLLLSQARHNRLGAGPLLWPPHLPQRCPLCSPRVLSPPKHFELRCSPCPSCSTSLSLPLQNKQGHIARPWCIRKHFPARVYNPHRRSWTWVRVPHPPRTRFTLPSPAPPTTQRGGQAPLRMLAGPLAPSPVRR